MRVRGDMRRCGHCDHISSRPTPPALRSIVSVCRAPRRGGVLMRVGSTPGEGWRRLCPKCAFTCSPRHTCEASRHAPMLTYPRSLCPRSLQMREMQTVCLELFSRDNTCKVWLAICDCQYFLSPLSDLALRRPALPHSCKRVQMVSSLQA